MKYAMAVVYSSVPATLIGGLVGLMYQSWLVAVVVFLFFLGLGLDVLLNGSDRHDQDD